LLKGQSREEGKKATANSLPVSQVNSHGRYQIDNHDDPNFDRKLDLVTAGAKPHIREHLLTKISKENCKIIVDYVLAFLTEVSPAETYRIDTIGKLKQLAEFHNPKSFKDMTRQDIIDFLDRLRKPESADPMHQWIGSYENNRIVLLRFFKWLYYPDIEVNKRPKPAVMENIPRIRRKETSIYKPTDMWTEEDDALFYKYCPSLRDKAWHAVARDTGCRPHEMLKLKIKDIDVVQTQTYQIARVTVNGKTGTRSPRINNGYPHLKKWLSQGHPFPGVPDSPIFCGVGKKNTGRRLSSRTINAMYENYKNVYFPKLLDDPSISEEDKRKIRDLLKKKWNPYVRRHTAATELSKALKDPVIIDQYMGWSHRGNTRHKYQHYYADDSFDAILQADGLLTPMGSGLKKNKKDLLKPKQCPNCDEPNTPETKFCIKCRYVLSYDAYNETKEEKEKAAKEAEESKKRLEELEAKQEILQANAASVLRALMAAEMGAKPQVEIITWNPDKEGSEALFNAAAIARAENQKREREHQQRRHNPNNSHLIT
jgi:integrase